MEGDLFCVCGVQGGRVGSVFCGVGCFLFVFVFFFFLLKTCV